MANTDLEDNIKLAFDLQKKGQYREAISVLYKVLETNPDSIDPIIQIAYLFYLYHDIKLAVEYYEKALSIEPDNELALQGLFTIYKNIKEYEKAIQVSEQLYSVVPSTKNLVQRLMILTISGKYSETIALYNENPIADDEDQNLNLYLGISYYNMRQYEEAKNSFDKVININKKNVSAGLYLAKIYYNEKHYNFANNYLNEILKHQENAEVYNLKGIIQLNLKNPTKASSMFAIAVKLDTKNSEYFYNLGVSYSLNGWLHEAEKCFINAIRLSETNLLYHYTLAYLYYELKEFFKSQRELDFIFGQDSNNQDALVLRALICTQQNNIFGAKNILDGIISKNDDNDFAFYAAGIVYKKLEMYEKAIEYFKRANELNNFSLEYMLEIADCLYKIKKYDEAQTRLQTLLKICSTYVNAYILKVKILIEQNDLVLAEYLVKRILTLDNNSDEGYYLNAQLYLLNNNFKEALNEIKKALILKPDNTKYYKFIAQINEEEQSYSNALYYYEEMLKISPNNAMVYFDCARCAAKNNELKKAEDYYFRAYTIDPENIDIILNYIDFMVYCNKHKKAMNFIYSLIKNKNSSQKYDILIPKYDEIRQIYCAKMPKAEKFLHKLFRF